MSYYDTYLRTTIDYYTVQKSVTRRGTLKSTNRPWAMERATNWGPQTREMMGRVVSIVVAPPDEMGARLPNQRTISGAHSNVMISRAMFESKAIVPNSAPLYSVMKMLESE